MNIMANLIGKFECEMNFILAKTELKPEPENKRKPQGFTQLADALVQKFMEVSGLNLI
jgi:hypothetical protein